MAPTPHPSRRPRPCRRRALIAALLAATVAAGAPACGGTDTPDRTDPSDQLSRGTDMSTTDSQSWTGFVTTTDLDVVAVDEAQGIDRMVRLALQGPPASVDAALTAAGFTADFRPGVKVFEPSLPDVAIDTMTDPSSAEDKWTNPDGRTLTRKVVRGTTDAGTDLIHIWAFTT